MNNVLAGLFQAFPFLAVIGLAAIFVLYAGATIAMPRFLVYPYLAILFTVTGSTFGLQEAVSPSIYSRGAGVLYFSFLMWLLLAATIWAKVSASLSRERPVLKCNLLPWIAGWASLLVAHAAIAVFIGVPVRDAIGPLGFSNFIWIGCLIVLLLSSFNSQRQLEELGNLIVLFALGRATFGLIRWAAFGGDPANAYANHAGVLIKLTFFDINDSLLCMIALSICIVRLSSDRALTKSTLWKVVYWLTSIAAVASIVLSYRRTAWIGMLLGGLVILSQLPIRKRIQLTLTVAPTVIAAMAYGAWKRLSQTKGAGGLEAFFFDIQTNRLGADTPRMLELRFAIEDFLRSPVWGIGSWGQYTNHQMISWQTGEFGGGFVHSGIIHIAFKSGILGLILLAGSFVVYASFVRKALKTSDHISQPLIVAGAAGVAFMLPDLAIGTPIPQVRTMQMLGLCLALPYLGSGVAQWLATERLRGRAMPNHTSIRRHGYAGNRIPT
jgi:hypothetical protein